MASVVIVVSGTEFVAWNERYCIRALDAHEVASLGSKLLNQEIQFLYAPEYRIEASRAEVLEIAVGLGTEGPVEFE